MFARRPRPSGVHFSSVRRRWEPCRGVTCGDEHMALRPLTKIVMHTTRNQDHVFYVDLTNLSHGEESFLNDVLPGFSAGVKNANSDLKVFEFELPGYYEAGDVAAVREQLTKSIVRESPAPATVA